MLPSSLLHALTFAPYFLQLANIGLEFLWPCSVCGVRMVVGVLFLPSCFVVLSLDPFGIGLLSRPQR
ncbi:MAG: hypothetical protein LBF21_01715 [Puniceicoccales bacterium]|nr:hypothetical protein [Puniceicoccales bacterium]